ncbi:hypothetical protein CR513_07769, partial [Mucuna pruriens]
MLFLGDSRPRAENSQTALPLFEAGRYTPILTCSAWVFYPLSGDSNRLVGIDHYDGDRSLQLLVFNEEFLVSASHQLALTTSLPFVHTARRSYRLNGPVKCSDCGDVGGSLPATLGRRSRNKVSVGEPAEGSLSLPHNKFDRRTRSSQDKFDRGWLGGAVLEHRPRPPRPELARGGRPAHLLSPKHKPRRFVRQGTRNC